MPIDPNLPLELDNGVAVDFIEISHNRNLILVRLPHGQHYVRHVQEQHAAGLRENPRSRDWWYDIETGVWHNGDAARCFVLRNRLPKQARNWEVYGPWFYGDPDLRETLRREVGVCWSRNRAVPEALPHFPVQLGFANRTYRYILPHQHEFYQTPQFVARQLAGLAQPDE